MAAKDILVARPTGGILAGPSGTTPPTDSTTALDPKYVPHGYVGEDGLSMTTERNTESIIAWGGDEVRVVQTEHSVEFTFTLIETNAVTAAAVFGDANVSGTGGKLDVVVTSDPLPRKSWVFDMKDGDRTVRVVVPDGQITEVGDTQFVHSEATGWECTLKAFGDGQSRKAFIYSDDGTTP